MSSFPLRPRRGHRATSVRRPRTFVAMLMLGASLFLRGAAGAGPNETERASAAGLQVQRLADDLRGRLAIPEEVVVSLVDRDPLVVSVRPMPDRKGAYLLSMERAFHAALAQDELEAVVAHELGHVWIYTHHPYLQAEQLANRIALKLVTRECLERVYAKLWGAGAVTDSLASFLGLPPAAPAAETAADVVRSGPKAGVVPEPR